MRMTDERLRAAFQPSLPPTLDDKLNLAYQAIREDEMNAKHGNRVSKTIFLIAAVMLIFTATALAVTWHEDFFHSAYGTAVNNQEARTAEVFDAEENRFRTEEYYGFERVDADGETAERLLGAYVAPLDIRTELGGYTFTLRAIALDENCIGAVTIDVENPSGHGIHKDQLYRAKDGEFDPITLYYDCANDLIDSSEIIADEGFTATTARIISYLTPFRAVDPADEITLNLCVFPGFHAEPLIAQLTLPALPRVPVKTLSADGIRGELSPLGLRLNYLEASADPIVPSGEELPADAVIPDSLALSADFFEAIPSAIVVHFASGESYTVCDDDAMLRNLMCSSCDQSFSNHWVAFNRLVDVDAVSSIALRYTEIRGTTLSEKEVTLLP